MNGALLIKRGEVGGGLELLRTALDELRETGFVPYYLVLLGALAQGLAGVGQVAQALATIDEALTKCERDEERWCVADLLRIKAELVLLAGGPGAASAAEEHFQYALHWTRRQEVLSMELRCAIGLARLWHAQGRTDPARELLAPVYGRFTEGFDTADLRAAKVLLASFGYSIECRFRTSLLPARECRRELIDPRAYSRPPGPSGPVTNRASGNA